MKPRNGHMRNLQSWSFWRVLLVSMAWVVSCVVVLVASVVFQLSGPILGSVGSAGIDAVSVGFSELLLVIPIVPPIVLFVAWLRARARRNSTQAV